MRFLGGKNRDEKRIGWKCLDYEIEKGHGMGGGTFSERSLCRLSS
jgi:hypothetical protein